MKPCSYYWKSHLDLISGLPKSNISINQILGFSTHHSATHEHKLGCLPDNLVSSSSIYYAYISFPFGFISYSFIACWYLAQQQWKNFTSNDENENAKIELNNTPQKACTWHLSRLEGIAFFPLPLWMAFDVTDHLPPMVAKQRPRKRGQRQQCCCNLNAIKANSYANVGDIWFSIIISSVITCRGDFVWMP